MNNKGNAALYLILIIAIVALVLMYYGYMNVDFSAIIDAIKNFFGSLFG